VPIATLGGHDETRHLKAKIGVLATDFVMITMVGGKPMVDLGRPRRTARTN
jgi:hypothetical protein